MATIEEYLAQFNTAPACAGFGPTDVPSTDFRIGTLIVYVIVAFFMVATSIWFLYVRQYRRRLFIRSLNPIVMGSLGSAACLLVRARYNYEGREHLSCSGDLALVYLFMMFNIVGDGMLVASFFVKQGFRAKFTTAALVAAEKEHQQETHKGSNLSRVSSMRATSEVEIGHVSGSITTGHSSVAHDHSTTAGIWRFPMKVWVALGLKSVATPFRWARGFWNHFLTISDALTFKPETGLKFAHAKWRYKTEDNRYVSPIRELSYDMLAVVMFSGALIVAYALRIGLFPPYMPDNGCTGCTLQWLDLVIVLGTMSWMTALMLLVLLRTKDVSDPLLYRRDLLISVSLSLIAWIGYILVVVDPGDLMKQQKVDWFVFEGIAALAMHWHRAITQLLRVLKFHNKQQQDLKLIDILQGDARGAILFEKYLMGELASENLLFWREGVKYKLNFGRDFDYSQQQAKVLYRTFITKHAQLPINISGELRETIETRFRSGVVGRNVFDENGPFERFIQSKAFKEYASSKADFSLPVSSSAAAQLQVVPSPSPLSTPHSSSLGQAPPLGALDSNFVRSQRDQFSPYEYIKSLS